MNGLTWTQTQVRRLKELGLDTAQEIGHFPTPADRNRAFQKIEKKQAKAEQAKLRALLTQTRQSRLVCLKENLCQALFKEGFTQVSTPTIISRTALAKMTIDETHPLFRQVYWLNEKQCLRPMLAPGLYSLMQDFTRLKFRPIRFFELGACFRRESDGARHSTEFTMLNLVEMGHTEGNCQDRLKELACCVAETSGLKDYRFESEDSKVYGTTLDVVAGPERIEVASGAVGPHPLDAAWGVTDTWVGMGFGIERLLMTAAGDTTIGRWRKSLAYLDGIRLTL